MSNNAPPPPMTPAPDGLPPPMPRASPAPSASVDLPTPGVTQTLRGLVSLWPVVGPIIVMIAILWRDSSEHATAITYLRAEVAKAASADDLAELKASVRDLSGRVDQRDEASRRQLGDIQRDLERVCARVQCGR